MPRPRGPAIGQLRLLPLNRWLPPTPDIDYRYTVWLRKTDDGIQYRLEGQHDGFPAYSVWILNDLISKHDPEISDQTPFSLFSIPLIGRGEFSVNTSGIIKPGKCQLTVELKEVQYSGDDIGDNWENYVLVNTNTPDQNTDLNNSIKFEEYTLPHSCSRQWNKTVYQAINGDCQDETALWFR